MTYTLSSLVYDQGLWSLNDLWLWWSMEEVAFKFQRTEQSWMLILLCGSIKTDYSGVPTRTHRAGLNTNKKHHQSIYYFDRYFYIFSQEVFIHPSSALFKAGVILSLPPPLTRSLSHTRLIEIIFLNTVIFSHLLPICGAGGFVSHLTFFSNHMRGRFICAYL